MKKQHNPNAPFTMYFNYKNPELLKIMGWKRKLVQLSGLQDKALLQIKRHNGWHKGQFARYITIPNLYVPHDRRSKLKSKI